MALKKIEGKVNPLKALKEKKSYVDSMQEDLEIKGVNFFEPSENGSLNIDTDYLSLPAHITEVPARDLGELLNAFTQQKMYMRTLLGWAELYLEEAQREYLKESQHLYSKLSETKMSEKAKERELNTDPDIFPFYEKYMDYKKKCMLLELNISSIEEAIFMISREVSRRTGDFNNDTRNYNVNK
jgi:hypothetical protein